MEVYRKVEPKKKKANIGRRPKHTLEYMEMVAKKVVEDGMTIRTAAKTFKASQGSVQVWSTHYKKGLPLSVYDYHNRPTQDGKIYQLEEQVGTLKKEIGELYLENKLLKKAMMNSQSKKKEDLSIITSENLDQLQEDARS